MFTTGNYAVNSCFDLKGETDIPVTSWGLHPFWDRLLRHDVNPGAATGVHKAPTLADDGGKRRCHVTGWRLHCF